MGTGISKEDRGVLAQIKLSSVNAMNKYSDKIDDMDDTQLTVEINKLLTSIKDEHGIDDIDKKSLDDKKKILKLLYNIQQAKSIKEAPKLLKGDISRYEDELRKFSSSKSTENLSGRSSFKYPRATSTRTASSSSTRSASSRPRRSATSGGKVGGFILRGGKKTLRKKRRKKQKNKKVTRKRFI